MSRRLIIGILVILIIGILGGTVVFVISRLRQDSGPASTTTTTSTGLATAESGSPVVTNPSGDDDADGLTNAEEVVWGTDPANDDSDGDGYLDGEEVAANHNPTIPSPNDKLPEGFRPGQNLQPLDLAPIQVDQFFVNDLNLEADKANFTEEYRSRYSENERTQENLIAFAKEKPIITQLPTPRSESIRTVPNDTAIALNHYLDTASDLDGLISPTVMSQVFIDLFENDDVTTAYGLAVATRARQQTIAELPVPPSAVPLQRLLLGFTEILIATYAQMAVYNVDPAKALAAINQLDAIDRQYVPLIQQELIRLKALAVQLEG